MRAKTAGVECAVVCPRVSSVAIHRLLEEGWLRYEKYARDIFVRLFSSSVLEATSLCLIPRNRRQGGGMTGVVF